MIRLLSCVIVMTAFTVVVHAQAPAARPAVPGPPARVTVFVDVNVVPMDTERVLLNQTVVVQGGRIAALGPASRIKVPKAAVRIDGQGKYLIPGLADMHVHVAQIPDSARMEQVLYQNVANGITTIRNMDENIRSPASEMLLRFRNRAARGELLSPHIYAGVGPGTATTPAEALKILTSAKTGGYDHVKLRLQLLPLFTTFAAAARKAGISLVGHYPRGATLEQALAMGYRSIDHLETLAMALVGPSGSIPDHFYGPTVMTEQMMQLPSTPFTSRAVGQAKPAWTFAPPDTVRARVAALRRTGAWVSPTYLVALQSLPALLNSDSATINSAQILAQVLTQLQEAGVGLLLGTDSFDPQSVFRELETIVGAGLTPYQALITGTRNVAAFLGTLNESGTIEVGKRADLVLLTGNPLQDIRHTGEQAGVMLGGRWLPPTERGPRPGEPQKRGSP